MAKGSKAVMNDEARWRAEEDARTMRRYAEISGDRKRMNAAQGVLRKELKQTQAVLSHGSGKKGGK